jgi:hypothetical protein
LEVSEECTTPTVVMVAEKASDLAPQVLQNYKPLQVLTQTRKIFQCVTVQVTWITLSFISNVTMISNMVALQWIHFKKFSMEAKKWELYSLLK